MLFVVRCLWFVMFGVLFADCGLLTAVCSFDYFVLFDV